MGFRSPDTGDLIFSTFRECSSLKSGDGGGDSVSANMTRETFLTPPQDAQRKTNHYVSLILLYIK